MMTPVDIYLGKEEEGAERLLPKSPSGEGWWTCGERAWLSFLWLLIFVAQQVDFAWCSQGLRGPAEQRSLGLWGGGGTAAFGAKTTGARCCVTGTNARVSRQLAMLISDGQTIETVPLDGQLHGEGSGYVRTGSYGSVKSKLFALL